jgi:hypothetical protein
VHTRRLIAGLAALVLAATLGSPALADDDFGSTQTISVNASIDGLETPAEVTGGGGNPCAGQEPFTQWSSTRDDRNYKQDTVEFFNPITPVPDAAAYSIYDGATNLWWGLGLEQEWSAVTPTHVGWLTGCVDPATGEPGPGGFTFTWVPLVSQDVVVAALSQRLEALLLPPSLTWPSMDREFGWLYVKAPMDFRIAPPAPVSLTATVTNVTGTVTASVSATPISVSFQPGEPAGAGVECSVASATAAFSVASPGQCSYSYQNSSAVGAGGEFGWRAALVWQVTTSSPQFPTRTLATVSYGTVAVAEAQAVVTG